MAWDSRKDTGFETREVCLGSEAPYTPEKYVDLSEPCETGKTKVLFCRVHDKDYGAQTGSYQPSINPMC